MLSSQTRGMKTILINKGNAVSLIYLRLDFREKVSGKTVCMNFIKRKNRVSLLRFGESGRAYGIRLTKNEICSKRGRKRLILVEDSASILWYNSEEKGDFISYERKRKIIFPGRIYFNIRRLCGWPGQCLAVSIHYRPIWRWCVCLHLFVFPDSVGTTDYGHGIFRWSGIAEICFAFL